MVAVRKRWAARRSEGAPFSWAMRSTAGRHDEVRTVGSAKSPSRTSRGWIETSRAMVTASLRIHPAVENTDMYMWSSTKIWVRSTDRRSR